MQLTPNLELQMNRLITATRPLRLSRSADRPVLLAGENARIVAVVVASATNPLYRVRRGNGDFITLYLSELNQAGVTW